MSEAAQPASAQAAPASEASQRETIQLLLSTRSTSRQLPNLSDQLVQSGASSQAKIGGAYFSGVTGSFQDPIAVPEPCEVTEF